MDANWTRDLTVCRNVIGALFALIISISLPFKANAQFIQLGSKLVGNGAVGQSLQGSGVALSADGNTVVVGGVGDLNNGLNGSTWVFTRVGGSWAQQGSKLVGSGAVGASVSQGASVAVSADGNTVIVGAPADSNELGAAWVFTRSFGSWRQQGGKLVGRGAIGPARQGSSVALSGDGNTAIVGGPFDNDRLGAAWVFTRSGNTWSQQGGKLIGSGAIGQQGQGRVAVSADGNTAILGGPADPGGVWVFARTGDVWTQQGDKIVSPAVNGGFGSSVALSADGKTFVVGARSGAGGGGAYVFSQNNGAWAQRGRLVGSRGPFIAGEQGSSVALSADGNTAVVGGPLGSGAAWAFGVVSGAWQQIGDPLAGVDAVGIAGQGASVAISGDGSTIAVGGPGDNGGVGAAWLYAPTSNPFITIDGVVNGASFVPGIGPGAWITVKGLNLSTTTRTWQASDFSGNILPTELDGVRATVNGKSAYIYYVSPTQLNVLAPDDTTVGPVPVQVTNTTGVSNVVRASQNPFAPALFTLAEPGTHVLAVRSDGVLLNPSTPAKPGDSILLFGTGFGPTTPAQPIGQLVNPAPLRIDVSVLIGGVPALLSFSGLVSPGLYQFNVVVPNIADGDRQVSMTGGAFLRQELFLTVKR